MKDLERQEHHVVGTQVVLGNRYIGAWYMLGKKDIIPDGEMYVEVFLAELFTIGNNWNVNVQLLEMVKIRQLYVIALKNIFVCVVKYT